MKQVIDGGTAGQRIENCDISGSVFRSTNLSGTEFAGVNMSKAILRDVNLSDITVNFAQIGGAKFCCIGPPPDKEGKQERQRPVTFENATLCDSTFKKVDLSNVKIADCKLDGMTIDGILVTDLLAAHKRRSK